MVSDAIKKTLSGHSRSIRVFITPEREVGAGWVSVVHTGWPPLYTRIGLPDAHWETVFRVA